MEKNPSTGSSVKMTNSLKNLPWRIFTIWGGLVFIGSMLIFLVPIWATGLLKEPRRTDWVIKFCRMWMAVFFPLSGVRLKISGRNHFEKGENYIVVCNHRSMMDVPISSPGIPGANKTIAKIELSRIPLFGIIYKRGSILLDRKSDASRKDSFEKMKKVLGLGMHMCIYPEGTRNKTDLPLKTFHDGAFKLSFESGKKIIPAIIRGTDKMLPHDQVFYFRPGRLEMKFLSPMDPADYNSPQELKESVFKRMWKELETNESK